MFPNKASRENSGKNLSRAARTGKVWLLKIAIGCQSNWFDTCQPAPFPWLQKSPILLSPACRYIKSLNQKAELAPRQKSYRSNLKMYKCSSGWSLLLIKQKQVNAARLTPHTSLHESSSPSQAWGSAPWTRTTCRLKPPTEHHWDS